MTGYGTTWPELGPINAFYILNFSNAEGVPRLLRPRGTPIPSEFSQVAVFNTADPIAVRQVSVDEKHLTMDSYNDNCQTLVLFRLAEQRYALDLDVVERILRAAAPTPVPETPDFVLGLVNLAGQLLPVISLRLCLGLPECPIRPEDHFVIVRTSRFTLALVVDEVENLSVINASQTLASEDALPGSECRARGLVKIDGEIILIYDVEKLLNAEDQDRILLARAAAGDLPT